MKEQSRRWRHDLKAFERKYLVWGFIPYYTYSKWNNTDGCEDCWWKFFRPTDYKKAEYHK